MIPRTLAAVVLAAMIPSAAFAAEEGRTMRVYMIGNSLTDVVNYEGFQQLAESRAHEHVWGRHMIPGAPIDWLWNREREYNWDDRRIVINASGRSEHHVGTDRWCRAAGRRTDDGYVVEFGINWRWNLHRRAFPNMTIGLDVAVAHIARRAGRWHIASTVADF